MKDLPKVFHNKLDKQINNNEKVYYSNNDNSTQTPEENTNKKNINQIINKIFSSSNYVYKANVEIILKDRTITKRIIGRNKDYLITMDNELIKINDIIDIKKTNK